MSIEKITSAYNFVPLQAKVVTPDWQDRTSQDVPLQDGLCAEIDLTLTNHTPLLVGGSDTEAGPKRFHCHPDGIPAIPGSSFRGMIRNVLEIASCASMKLIDDRALSLRDLDLDAYKQAFRSKPRAGWLSFCHDRKSWVILEVDYGFIEQRQMQDIKIEGHRVHDLIFKQWELASDDDKRKAELKYRAIGKPLKTWFMPDDLPNAYKLCKKDAQGKVKVGYIVFTGQPGDMDKNPSEHKKNNKHREFVFLDSEKSTNGTLTVPAGVMQKFIQNHSDSSDWKYLLSPDSVLKNKGVPVFFLTEKNQQKASVSSLGLAMMYRIPGFYSLGELALKQQRRESKLDFVETLFGLIKQSDHEQSRRSRVSFGDLRLTGSNTKPWEAPSAFSQPTVLNGPKPSFYPNYIVQKERGGKLSGPATTLMDSSAKLRGWKRYPVHAPASVKGVPPPPEKSQASVQTQLQPLRAGLSFAGRVRLHNVTREELGAVLWALTWGGNSELRHSLGMGKPFGLGQVSVNITQLNVRSNDTPQLGNNEIRSYVQAFERWMEKNVPAWKSVLHELLAMANPAAPGVSQLRPLKLNMAGKSEFREAKQKKLALQPYSAIR